MNASESHRMQDWLNRRIFLKGSAGFIGSTAAATIMQTMPSVQKVHGESESASSSAAAHTFPTFPPKAKRIIYLFQSGAPSQMDLFDPKPLMLARRGEDLPASIRKGQRLTTMTSGQSKFPVAPSMFQFKQHGESGMWWSDIMPNMARHSDRWCMIRSMKTEAINHDPAITFFKQVTNLRVDRALVRGQAMVWAVKIPICRLTLCSQALVAAGRTISRSTIVFKAPDFFRAVIRV